ncbi:hypothetical protein OYT1_ch0898 [Ferriphaselus amnicola]|uniref:Uncharacterized protein n=1 Tax=Ferriphaselus amnicola TaxID=1188319 RepID=A0A2Z6GA94_9PROT|nr:hypothetical protein [Ferriphaselus amnicola]BBE50461.1 hypothetical protein OYT1_ch0898 [Ferriphaselus amnicola]
MTSQVGDVAMQARAELRLRLMIEASDEDGVAALIPSIETGLCGLARIATWSCERYWKFPKLFDCDLLLAPEGSPSAAFDRILGLATHWQRYDNDDEAADREAIWSRNVTPDGMFIHPQIEWVQMSQHPELPRTTV